MLVSTPDMGTTVSGEISEMLLSRDGGISAIICCKFVDSLFKNVMRLTCYLSKVELSKELTHCVKETVIVLQIFYVFWK